jgi:hypothetical protein
MKFLLSVLLVLVCSVDFIWSQAVSGQYATIPSTGPYCINTNYRSCGFPLVINITSPASAIGAVAYMPQAVTHSLKHNGLLNLRILTPNSLEPDNGAGANQLLGSYSFGCPNLDANNPYYSPLYQISKPYNNGTQAYKYHEFDDGTPYNQGDIALLIYRGGNGGCGTIQKQRAAQELGVKLIIQIDNILASSIAGGMFGEPTPYTADMGDSTDIPVITIPKLDGDILWKLAVRSNYSNPFNISIWGAGTTDLTTRENLIAFGKSFSYSIVVPFQQYSNATSPQLHSWAEIAADITLDHCYNAVHGLWCENVKLALQHATNSLYYSCLSILTNDNIFPVLCSVCRGCL